MQGAEDTGGNPHLLSPGKRTRRPKIVVNEVSFFLEVITHQQ